MHAARQKMGLSAVALRICREFFCFCFSFLIAQTTHLGPPRFGAASKPLSVCRPCGSDEIFTAFAYELASSADYDITVVVELNDVTS